MTPRWGMERPEGRRPSRKMRLYEAPFASSGTGLHFRK